MATDSRLASTEAGPSEGQYQTEDNVCLFMLNIPPTDKVIWRWDYSLKSHPTDRSLGSNLWPLVYKACGLPTVTHNRGFKYSENLKVV